MKTSAKIAVSALCLAVITSAGAVRAGGAPGAHPAAPAARTMDIVETAVKAGSFTTLVTAVQAAGLVETLQGAGPFTVFAPTDAAFAKLPAGTLEALLADKPRLTAVLTYHVVGGKLLAADVVKVKQVTTVQGNAAMVSTADGPTIDGARIVQTDILCSNGVIHVIDAVMLP
jgi:uncharacterized surface protein with fasciclin (FAS1) repeats